MCPVQPFLRFLPKAERVCFKPCSKSFCDLAELFKHRQRLSFDFNFLREVVEFIEDLAVSCLFF